MSIKYMCDCCGKEFYSKYDEGGYIDHFENFARRFQTIIKRGDMLEEICYDGNDLRTKNDIKVRLKCFEKYCEKTGNKEIYETTKCQVEKHISKLIQLDEIHDRIVDLVKGLDKSEREYVGLKY